MKKFNRETLREKLLEEKVKELEGIIQRKEDKEKKEKDKEAHKEALIYIKGVCEGYKQRQQENNIESFYR